MGGETLTVVSGDMPDLPEGWRYSSLADLLCDDRDISYGIVQPGSIVSDGVPVVRVNNIKDGRISQDDVLQVSSDIEKNYVRTRLQGGEVLLTLVGSLGETAVVPKEMSGWNVARAVGVIPVSPEIGSRWVELCLRSPLCQHLIHIWATTTVQATLNLRDVRNLPIPMPPIKEREAIAEILGSLDDKIELNRRTNETLEAMARAVFKSWFVDFDPVHAKFKGRQPDGMDAETAKLFPSSIVDSEIGRVPKGWKVQALDETANFLNGIACQKFPPTGDDSLPVIKIADLRNGISDTSDRADPSVDAIYIVKNGDVLFSWSGSLLVKIWTGGSGVLNQHLFKVTSDHFPRWFYYFWVQEHLPNFQSIAQDKATTMGHIKRHHLTDALVVIPNPEVLKKADAIIAPFVEQFVRTEEEIAILTTTRDALLPRLLSREITVKTTD